jgi:hypothetical protein
MYKERMKKWGLRKNIKEHEVIAILNIASERDADGKKTLIQKHNQVVDIERCLRHARRKGIQKIGQSPANVPAYISCTTPPPAPMLRLYDDDTHLVSDHYDVSQPLSASSVSLFWTPKLPENHEENIKDLDSEWSSASTPIFDEEIVQMTLKEMSSYFSDHQNIGRSPSPPKMLSVPEQLFYNIKTYYAGSFENGAWTLREKDSGTLSSLSGLVDPDHRNEFLGYCYMAVDLRKRGLLVEFRRVLSKAFSIVQDILQSNYPRTLDRLFESFLYLTHNGHLDVALLLRDHILGLATIFASNTHPWGRIFRLIGTLNEASLEQTIAKSWQCNNDALDDGLGPFSDLSLLARLNYIQNVHGAIDPIEEERRLRRLLKDCERLSDKPFIQIHTIMFSLGQNMLVQRRYSEAETAGLSILSHARKEPRISLDMRVDAISLAARGQYNQNKQNLAEKTIRDAIRMLVDERGKTGPLAIQYMNTLESWLREWGREKEADELKVAIDLVIGLDKTDMG